MSVKGMNSYMDFSTTQDILWPIIPQKYFVIFCKQSDKKKEYK